MTPCRATTSLIASRTAGWLSVDAIRMNADFNPGFGGPIKQDYAVVLHGGPHPARRRLSGRHSAEPEREQPNAWTYRPDTSGTLVENNAKWTDVQGRVTWQASPRNKFAGELRPSDALQLPVLRACDARA